MFHAATDQGSNDPLPGEARAFRPWGGFESGNGAARHPSKGILTGLFRAAALLMKIFYLTKGVALSVYPPEPIETTP